MASVVLEESHPRCCIPRLEETDDLGQQGEGARVIVGSGDEAEHLDLRFNGRAVAGEHVNPIVLREQWLRAYDFTTDRGAAALNDFARTNDPFANLGKMQISVEVSSVIRASPDSFRVAWIQRAYENGSLATTAFRTSTATSTAA